MTPRLVSSYFAARTLSLDDLEHAGAQNPYARMARVLEHTAEKHLPGWEISVRRVTPPDLTKHKTASHSHLANTQKMECWADAVHASPDGARLLLIDVDTFIVRPLDDAWSFDFDVAYTVKDGVIPFNSGVVFVRVNARSRAFIEEWRAANRRMLGDRIFHEEWRSKKHDGKHYGGINQASLGYLLHHPELIAECRLLELPCLEWNCEDTSWDRFDPRVTRIVHVKSALRRSIFFTQPAHPKVRILRRLWCVLERQALGSEAATA